MPEGEQETSGLAFPALPTPVSVPYKRVAEYHDPETARDAGVNLISGKNCERKCSAPFQSALHALWIVKTADGSAVRAFGRPWACRGLPQPPNFRSSNPMLNPAACTSTRFNTLSVPRTWHRRIAPVS